MVEGIINLTRKVLPRLTANAKENIANINSMPEMVLNKMARNGDKSILYTDMNQCKAAIIRKKGITTSYTDALHGCNSVGAAIKLKSGENLFVLSHYVPTNIDGQVNAIKKQLAAYARFINKDCKPKLFFNIRGFENNGKLEATPNNIVDKIIELFNGEFKKGVDYIITPYNNGKRPAFFSSANIFQFSPNDTNKLKITNVGEQEKFIDLTV